MDIAAVKDTTPIPKDDRRAKQEERELYRREDFKNVLHWVSRSLVYIFFCLFLVILVVRVWHLVTPIAWRWLSELQVDGIDKIVFSGTIGGIVGGYFRDKIQKDG